MDVRFTRKVISRFEILLVTGAVVLAMIFLPEITGAMGDSWAYPLGYPPKPPSNLRTEPGVNNIELTWHPSPSYGLKGYLVYRGTDPTTISHTLNTSETLVIGDRWLDFGVAPKQDYYYCLKAINIADELSEYCSEISNVPVSDVPPEPARSHQLRIHIPDSGGRPGDTVRVPIKIGNADGLVIDAMKVWVTYDPDIITAVTVTKTMLLRNYAWDSETDLEGAAAAVVLPTGNKPLLYGEATLFEVVFQVKGEIGDVSPIDIPLAFTIGTNTYKTEIYTDTEASPVPLILEGGTFQVTDVSFMRGDIEPAERGDGDVDMDDAHMALAIAVANRSANHRQLQVGDINGDGRINAIDAAQIRQLAPDGHVASSPTVDRTLQASQREADGVAISIGRASGIASNTVTLPIKATGAALAQAGASDLIVNYNPKMVQLTGVRTGDLTSNFIVTHTRRTYGTVRIGLMPATPGGVMGNDTGVLAYLDFFIHQFAPSGWSPVSLASTHLGDVYGRDFASSDLQISMSMESGALGTFRLYLPCILR